MTEAKRRGPKKKDPELVKEKVSFWMDKRVMALLRAEVKEHGGTQPALITKALLYYMDWDVPCG